jgi:hypothetical protein
VLSAYACLAITGETGTLSYRACTLPSNGHSMAYMLQYYDMESKNNEALHSVIIIVSKPIHLKQNGVCNTRTFQCTSYFQCIFCFLFHPVAVGDMIKSCELHC